MNSLISECEGEAAELLSPGRDQAGRRHRLTLISHAAWAATPASNVSSPDTAETPAAIGGAEN